MRHSSGMDSAEFNIDYVVDLLALKRRQLKCKESGRRSWRCSRTLTASPLSWFALHGAEIREVAAVTDPIYIHLYAGSFMENHYNVCLSHWLERGHKWTFNGVRFMCPERVGWGSDETLDAGWS